jgi:uncharacterized membrane protein
MRTNDEKINYVNDTSIKSEGLKRRVHKVEKPVRSVAKSVSWRIVATLTTILLVFVFGRDLTLASMVGVTELALKTVIYYLHERVWNLSSFGRTKKAT